MAAGLVKTLFAVAFISAVAAGAGYALQRQDISKARQEASANAVAAVTKTLTPILRPGPVGSAEARSLADALSKAIVGRSGVARVRLFGAGGKLLASTQGNDPSSGTKPAVQEISGVIQSGQGVTVPVGRGDVSTVGGDPTLATFERIRSGRGVLVAEIDQPLGPVDALGGHRWRDATRESEIATALFLILALVVWLVMRAGSAVRGAVRGRARPAAKLAPVAPIGRVREEARTDDAPTEEPGPGTTRGRRATDGQVSRLQTELRAREDEIRRLSDEMASLARDAQVRIAELEAELRKVTAPRTTLAPVLGSVHGGPTAGGPDDQVHDPDLSDRRESG